MFHGRDRGGEVGESRWNAWPRAEQPLGTDRDAAYLARKDIPGLEVFGGICLSRAVAGINPAAVEEMAKMTGGWGRVVWMPTLDAENVRRKAGSDLPFTSVFGTESCFLKSMKFVNLLSDLGSAIWQY